MIVFHTTTPHNCINYNSTENLHVPVIPLIYCKIPIISHRDYFWSKGLFANFFLGGGDLYLGVLYMDEYLCFENAIFC